jgi:hypothetical protein
MTFSWSENNGTLLCIRWLRWILPPESFEAMERLLLLEVVTNSFLCLKAIIFVPG